MNRQLSIEVDYPESLRSWPPGFQFAQDSDGADKQPRTGPQVRKQVAPGVRGDHPRFSRRHQRADPHQVVGRHRQSEPLIDTA
jgi:hypothetical protein